MREHKTNKFIARPKQFDPSHMPYTSNTHQIFPTNKCYVDIWIRYTILQGVMMSEWSELEGKYLYKVTNTMNVANRKIHAIPHFSATSDILTDHWMKLWRICVGRVTRRRIQHGDPSHPNKYALNWRTLKRDLAIGTANRVLLTLQKTHKLEHFTRWSKAII